MAPLWLWITFTASLLALLIMDALIFGRQRHKQVTVRSAAVWSAFWIGLAGAFGLWLWFYAGGKSAVEFFTGYIIEESLSIDNLFVFVLIFHSFGIAPELQPRVLAWGIFGALAMRGGFIAAGAAFIHSFSWAFDVFGVFLVYAAIRLLMKKPAMKDPQQNPLLRWAGKILPVEHENQEEKFFLRREGRLMITPLLLVLIAIESADLLFAVDSIPAVFGVTRDPFIVFSSNACAVLGLRALYFVLASSISHLAYLTRGISAILLFIGAKMLLGRWWHLSEGLSLAVIGSIIAVAVAASLIFPKKDGSQLQGRAMQDPQPSRPGENVKLTEIADSALVSDLSSSDAAIRDAAAHELFERGRARAEEAIQSWRADAEIGALLTQKATVGIAVTPQRFPLVRAAAGNPPLAEVPPDQDAQEFEWKVGPSVHLDILTTRDSSQTGAISKFLARFGEGIQQVEFLVEDVDRATELVHARFDKSPVYPQTRRGADGTQVNFFLVPGTDGRKILIELVELPR